MNDDPMDRARAYEARAEQARQRLADNLREIGNVGGRMLRKARRVSVGALIGFGALGVFLLVATRLRSRARKNSLQRYFPREPSFVGQALRRIALSMLGVLASRMAGRVPLPLPRSKPAE